MKFEFVPGDEIVIAPGRTVKRIRALVAIAALDIVPGDVGGYIEHSKSLSGDAWVYGNAQVSGDAQVYGDGAIFWASKVGTENGTLTAFITGSGNIWVTRGCFSGSVDDFLVKSEQVHDQDTHLEYRLLIEVAHSRLTRYQKNNPKPSE